MTLPASADSASPLPDELRSSFLALKPVCVQLMEQQTQRRLFLMQRQRDGEPGAGCFSFCSLLSCLQSLHAALRSQPAVSVLGCLDYTLFPLTSLLSQPRCSDRGSEACSLSALSSLSLLLRLSADEEAEGCVAAAAAVIGDARGVEALLCLLLRLLEDAASEEMRAAAVDAAAALLSSLCAHVRRCPQSALLPGLLSPAFHLAVSHLVALLLGCLGQRSKLLQWTSLQCLSALLRLLSASGGLGVCMLTCYLPGLVSALQRLLVSDDKAASAVKAEAVRLLAEAVCAVMEGDDVRQLQEEDERRETQEPAPQLLHLRALLLTGAASSSAAGDALSTPSASEASPTVGWPDGLLLPRDRSWYGDTRLQLTAVMRAVFGCSPLSPRSATLEAAYVGAARLLLQRCGRRLKDCALLWVEFVLAASQHLHPSVREEAAVAIAAFSRLLAESPPDSSQSVVAALSSRLLHHLLSLPRLLPLGTEQRQLRLLRTIAGYEQLLGAVTTPDDSNALFALLSSHAAFPHAFLALLPVLAVSVVSSGVTEPQSAASTPAELLRLAASGLRFSHAPDDSVRLALLDALTGLGRWSGPRACELLDALLSFLPGGGRAGEASGRLPELLALLNSLLVGLSASTAAPESASPYLVLALDCLLQPELLSPSQPPRVLSLLLSGVAVIASCLRAACAPLLMHVLFPLLAHLGSASELVASSAQTALTVLAASLSYPSASQLVLANVDYVVDGIAAELLSPSPSPAVLPVMRAVLGRLPAGPQLIVLLDDVLQTVMRALSDEMAAGSGRQQDCDPDSRRLVLLDVLLSVVSGVRRLHEDSPPPAHPSAASGLYSSVPAVQPARLLRSEADGWYGVSSVKGRVRQRVASHRREDREEEREQRERKEREVRESAADWHRRLEARRERRAMRQERGGGGDGSDSEEEEDEEGRAARRRHRELREQERKDEEVQPTREQRVVLDIALQCRSWLGQGGLRQQLLVLDILSQALQALLSIPKELFPLIAQTWPSLLAAFTRHQRASPPLPVASLLAAVELLELLCRLASRFLLQRFHAELWPVLQPLLAAQREQLLQLAQLSPSALPLSPPYRIVMAALASLCFLLRHPDLVRGQMLSLSTACLPFLSSRLPAAVQARGLELCRACAALDVDVLFSLLSRIAAEAPLDEAEDEQEAAVSEEAALLDWREVDGLQLDRQGELRLIGHRLQAGSQRRQQPAELSSSSGGQQQPELLLNSRLLLSEMRRWEERPMQAAD